MGERVFIALALVIAAVVPAHAQLPASVDERIQRDECNARFWSPA